MKKKIDKVLDSVKDPINLLSLLDMNFVKKVSYSESEKKMLIYTYEEECRRHGNKCEKCMGCGWGWAAVKIRRQLTANAIEGLRNAFAGIEVEIA